MKSSNSIKRACWLPPHPHLLVGEKNPGWQHLADAAQKIGDQWAAEGIERIIYFSTHWLSVLGHLYQARPHHQGVHVDENWYAFGEISYQLKVDVDFAHRAVSSAVREGFQARAVDYEGFPIDAGTLVADALLNRQRFSVNMVSCSIYSTYSDTLRLAETVRRALVDSPVPTACAVVSGLSGRWFSSWIDPKDDRVASEADRYADEQFLQLLTKGQLAEARQRIPSYTKNHKVDMGLKALAFLEGMGVISEGLKGHLHSYNGVWGTGAAVLSFNS